MTHDMTIALWCLLVAFSMTYVFSSLAKVGGERKYNNYKPREFLAKLEGWRARAHAVQLNQFEFLPMFVASVLVATYVGKIPQATLDNIAMAIVASRVVYGCLYIGNYAPARSLVWVLGFAGCISLFVMSA